MYVFMYLCIYVVCMYVSMYICLCIKRFFLTKKIKRTVNVLTLYCNELDACLDHNLYLSNNKKDIVADDFLHYLCRRISI